MEDFILREIDRLGEMLTLIARRLGLLDGGTPSYTVSVISRTLNSRALIPHPVIKKSNRNKKDNVRFI